MKKHMKGLICGLAAVMVLGLAACGGVKKNETKAGEITLEETTRMADPSEETSAAEEETETSADNGKYATVAEFAASDAVQSQITELKSSLAEKGMDIVISGEDNKLVYTYTYKEITDTTGMAEALQSAMASQAETFVAVASSMKEAVNVEAPVVVVRYVDANGGEIYSEEFTAE